MSSTQATQMTIEVAPARTQSRGSLVSDVVTVFSRELRPVLRDPFSVIFAMIQPLVFLGLFAPLLPETTGGTADAALQWFVPGVVVMSCLFATSMTGSSLLYEMQTGSHERMLVTPLRRPALLVGRALKEIVPMLVQTAVIVAVMAPFGFELHVAGVVSGLLLLTGMCVGLGALSYTLALAAKDKEWLFWAVQQTLIFPLLLLAGILLPVDDGPRWLQVASGLNPLTYVVDAERALFAGDFSPSALTGGVVAAVLVGAFGLLVGTRAMRRSS